MKGVKNVTNSLRFSANAGYQSGLDSEISISNIINAKAGGGSELEIRFHSGTMWLYEGDRLQGGTVSCNIFYIT